ncbi:MAG: DUF6020 family protein [Roseiflexaceae bacterium]|nr:DUF6020 family protein [Roseiflexaceae bacterium]
MLILFSALAYALLRAVVVRLRQFSRRAQVAWLVTVPLLGVFATLVIPTFPPQPWVQYAEVTLTPLNARNPAAQGSEVWLLRAFNGKQTLDLTAFEHNGVWEWRDGALMAPTGITAPLRWRGWVRDALTLDLLAHPWSGKVRVQVGDQVQELDLYAEMAQDRRLRLTPPPSLWTRAQQGALWLADIVSFGALLSGAMLLLATWRPSGALARAVAWRCIAAVGGLGAVGATTAITHIVMAHPPETAAGWLFLVICCFALSGGLAYWLLRAAAARLRRFSRRAQVTWLVSAPLLGVFATLVIPTFPPPPWGQYAEVTITPLNARNPAARGSEVWLLHALCDGHALDLATFTHDGTWEWRDNYLMASTGATAPLRWRGRVCSELAFYMLQHPWSGKVLVQVGDQTQEIDLYANTARTRVLMLTPPSSLWTHVQQGALWLADIVSFGALLTSALLLVATWQPRMRPFVLAWHWYALPCVVVWSFMLLVFWPGLLSLDSIDQWAQMLSGQYNDAHPAFHTLTMRVLTLLWLSPAAVALAQISALALAFGLALRELALLGVEKWVQIVLTALFALSPVNNLMVITLWKDIPYAIAMLFVFWALLRVWRTDGAWLRSWRALVVIGAALAALALYRHNGAPTALLILPTFLLVGRQARWRRVAAIGGVALVLVLIVKVGVYRALDVVPTPQWFARQVQIHQMGAFVTHSEHLGGSDRMMLERLLPFDQWRSRYSCYGLNPLLYGEPRPNVGFFDAHVREFTELWQQLALRDPATLIQHQSCLTTLIWRVTQPDDGYLATYPGPNAPYVREVLESLRSRLPVHLKNSALGLLPESVFPEVRDALIPQLRILEHPEWIWLIWRPALYFYITLWCVAIVCVRCRSWLLAGLSLPVLAQSLIWMLLLTVQDFRFQYPTYIIGLLAPGLLFIPTSAVKGSQPIPGD